MGLDILMCRTKLPPEDYAKLYLTYLAEKELLAETSSEALNIILGYEKKPTFSRYSVLDFSTMEMGDFYLVQKNFEKQIKENDSLKGDWIIHSGKTFLDYAAGVIWHGIFRNKLEYWSKAGISSERLSEIETKFKELISSDSGFFGIIWGKDFSSSNASEFDKMIDLYGVDYFNTLNVKPDSLSDDSAIPDWFKTAAPERLEWPGWKKFWRFILANAIQDNIAMLDNMLLSEISKKLGTDDNEDSSSSDIEELLTAWRKDYSLLNYIDNVYIDDFLPFLQEEQKKLGLENFPILECNFMNIAGRIGTLAKVYLGKKSLNELKRRDIFENLDNPYLGIDPPKNFKETVSRAKEKILDWDKALAVIPSKDYVYVEASY